MRWVLRMAGILFLIMLASLGERMRRLVLMGIMRRMLRYKIASSVKGFKTTLQVNFEFLFVVEGAGWGGEEIKVLKRWRCKRNWSGTDAEEVDCREFEDVRTFSHDRAGD